MVLDYIGPHHIAVQEIEAMMDANGRHYSAVRVRSVIGNRSGEWLNLLTVVQPFPSVTVPERQKSRRYEGTHLLEDWLASDELLPFIDRVVKNQAEVDGEKLHRADSGGLGEREAFPGNNAYSQYPGHLFRTNGRSELVVDNKPLLAHALPYYPDMHEAIRDWIGVAIHRGMGDARIGCVLVFLPECRIRIESCLHVDEVLTLSLSLADPVIPDLRLKGAWQDGGLWHSFDCAVSDSRIVMPMPMSAGALDVYLIGPDERVYDFHREDRHSCIGHERVLGSSPSNPLDLEVLEEAIRRGEGESIEFKEFVKPGNQKEKEIVETVIAFANTRGGTIFLGVDDYCAVVGIERDVVNAFPGSGRDLEKPIQDYIGHLRKRLADEMNRCPVIEMSPVTSGGYTVLLVRVPEGDQKIYARRHDNAIYVRRGASNVIADPDRDIPSMLLDASPGQPVDLSPM